MEEYTNYCTETQTKKALELGAPIEEFFMFYDKEEEPHFTFAEMDNCFKNPTTEQMRGWIMDNGAIDFYVDRDLDEELNYCDTYGYVVAFSDEDRFVGTGIDSYTEATIAAIDAALTYIEKQKK